MFEITLGVNQSNQRFDKVLQKHLREAPKSFIYKMLRKKNITLNKQKAIGNEITVAGDTVQFFLSEETYNKMRGEGREVISGSPDFPEIPILYEDNDVCVFVKPAGILSQKAVESDYSVNEWIVWHAVEKGIVSDSKFEVFRPSVCNRLDRNTGGIMVAGLSEKGLQVLSEMFRERTVKKYYYALVKGRVTEPREIRGYLKKDERTNQVQIFGFPVPDAKPIHTKYEPLKVYKDRTLLKVHLLTGRSHQIRAHLASIGHPILGDPKYGDTHFNMDYNMFMQCLFSYRTEFPETVELPGISGRVVEAPIPKNWPV